ncbi:hypothetical protein NPIL_162111 [Nephila pilipes]|uniref:Uncharacterized protein n=1 Tax=Nephila pilipes TaxID=299642 RepID=A0A8X6PKL5_NEPPI|nr:hypothetical protein NPIL_162111 [Nephila pilipes]
MVEFGSSNLMCIKQELLHFRRPTASDWTFNRLNTTTQISMSYRGLGSESQWFSDKCQSHSSTETADFITKILEELNAM